MMKDMRKIELASKRIVMRVDLNLSRDEKGVLQEGARLLRLIPHLRSMLDKGAQLLLLSHLGRPQGRVVAELSLRPVAAMLQKHLGENVHFVDDCLSEAVTPLFDEGARVILAENLRFHKEEEANDDDFARVLASRGDVYVNDAFSCCHRAHASCVAITRHLPSYGGGLLLEEYETLQQLWQSPQRPNGALIGGSKIGTKIGVLQAMVRHFDMVVVGGAMAHNFLVARGHDVGASFFEPAAIKTAKRIEELARQHETALLLPMDGWVGTSLEDISPKAYRVEAIPPHGVMGDIGPETTAAIVRALASMKSLIWNGPLGAFEHGAFARSTLEIGRALAELTARKGLLSVIGGGDTIAALSQNALADKMSYASLSGGAFLAWLAGEPLAGLAALKQN